MFGRACFVKAVGFFADHIAAKTIDRIEGDGDVRILQKQPDVVIGRFSRAKLLDFLFEGEHLRQLEWQFGLIAIGKLLESNLGVLG